MKAFLVPERTRIAVGAVLAVLSGIFAFIPLVSISEFGAELLGDRERAVIWRWVIVGSAAAMVSTALYFGAIAVCHRADVEVRMSIRRRIARHLAAVPLGWFLTGGSARVKRAASDDVVAVHTLVGHVIPDMAHAITAPTATVVYLFVVDAGFAAVVVGYVLIVLMASMHFVQIAQKQYSDRYDAAGAELGRSAVELVDGITVAKAFGRDSANLNRFGRSVDLVTRLNGEWTGAVSRSINAVTILLAPSAMLVVVISCGIWFLDIDVITTAELIPFVVAGVGLPASFMHLAQLGYPVHEAARSAGSIAELFDVESLPEPGEPKSRCSAAIEFDAVGFSYGDRKVLTDMSFRIEAGTVTALVGPSGSGKSTICQLIARFYDAESGSVRVGERDVREYRHDDLLSSMSIVFQESVLVRGSIADNIRLSRPDATDAHVTAAAEAAAVADEISALPDGYDTPVAGQRLSGGQRQRIALARAILTDAPMVLLDEFTAHADPQNEARIHRALAALLADKTVVVVAHRLHTVVGADQILVIDGGTVAERGTHTELLDRDGSYAALWRSQKVTA